MDVPHLISIVGAGPGDPELLTVKALKRIEEADVILYDALLGEEILALANPKCIKKYVGKRVNDGQNQTIRQDDINAEFTFWAGKNKKLVRLKAGDPMIFGRGAEEIRFCVENKLNYEVIPGITAGVAGASLFSVPLTERGKNNMLLFYTGQNENGGFTNVESVVQVIQTGSPVLVYMGVNNLPSLAEQLLNQGVQSNLPVLVLSKISQRDQKIYSTTLGEADSFLLEKKPEIPAIIMLGKYANQI